MPGRSNRLNIAVAGLGNVGRETARLLWTRRAQLLASAGTELRLAAVCDRDAGPEARRLKLPARVRRTRDWATLVKDPSLDVVVELFGGVDAARRLVLGALGSGKHVVTGNKHLLSRHWNEVFAAARAGGRKVHFEAAVAGAIPIISALRSGLAANRIHSIRGIFNGTTNYILSRMAKAGLGREEALREAQRLGMAEKDPTLDLNGSDTLHKVSVLGSLLTGAWLSPERIPRQGIDGIEAEDIRFAVEKLGRTARLLGTVAVRWGRSPVPVEAHVQPTLVPLEHPLASVHGGYNAAIVDASPAQDLMFYGKGAGPGPAASAVVGDILALARERGAGGERGLESGARPPRLVLVPEPESAYYLRLSVKDEPGALSRIAGHLGRRGVSIAGIYQGAPSSGRPASVMITTHPTSRARFDRARRAVLGLSTVSPRHAALRLLPA